MEQPHCVGHCAANPVNAHLHLWGSRTISSLQRRELRVTGWKKAKSHGKYLANPEFEPRPAWLESLFFFFQLFEERKCEKWLQILKCSLLCLRTRCFGQIRHKSPKLNLCYRQMNESVFYNFPMSTSSSFIMEWIFIGFVISPAGYSSQKYFPNLFSKCPCQYTDIPKRHFHFCHKHRDWFALQCLLLATATPQMS